MEVNAFNTLCEESWVAFTSQGQVIDPLMDLLEWAARIQSVLCQMKSAVLGPPVE